MADLNFTVSTGATPQDVTTGDTQTLLQIIAPSNHRVVVRKVVVSFNGVAPTDAGIRVEVLKQADGGSGSSAITPVKHEQSLSESIQTTAAGGHTSEPTAGVIYHSEYVHNQEGVELAIPNGRLVIAGGERLGVRAVAGTLTATIKGACTVHCEE